MTRKYNIAGAAAYLSAMAGNSDDSLKIAGSSRIYIYIHRDTGQSTQLFRSYFFFTPRNTPVIFLFYYFFCNNPNGKFKNIIAARKPCNTCTRKGKKE